MKLAWPISGISW